MTEGRNPFKISRLDTSVNVVMDDSGSQTERIQIDYVPVTLPEDAPGVETELDDYRGRLELQFVELPLTWPIGLAV